MLAVLQYGCASPDDLGPLATVSSHLLNPAGKADRTASGSSLAFDPR